MCERTRKQLNSLPTQDGAMTSTSKEAFNLLIDELEKNGKKTEAVAQDLRDLRDNFNACAKILANTSEQVKAISNAQVESMKRTNEIYEMLNTSGIEEKAAQMDLLQKFVGSKFGKVCIGLAFVSVVALGVAGIYLIDHYKEVSTIAQAIK